MLAPGVGVEERDARFRRLAAVASPSTAKGRFVGAFAASAFKAAALEAAADAAAAADGSTLSGDGGSDREAAVELGLEGPAMSSMSSSLESSSYSSSRSPVACAQPV